MRFLCLAVLATAAHAQEIPGCLHPPGFDRAQPPRVNAAQTALLPGPRIFLESIRRGFDDGSAASCSNAGVLTLSIDPRDAGPTDVYAFEVVSGRLPAGLLPQGFVEPVEIDPGVTGFRFYWLDLPPGSSELSPLGAVVSINRTSFAGDRSEPMLIDIVDPGGAAASTASRWNSTLLWAGTAMVLMYWFVRRSQRRRRGAGAKAELDEIQARLRELANEKRQR